MHTKFLSCTTLEIVSLVPFEMYTCTQCHACSDAPPQHQGLRTLVLSFYLIIVKTVPKDDISNPQTLCQLEKWQVVLQSQCDALINLGHIKF